MNKKVALEVQELVDGVMTINTDGTCEVIVGNGNGNNIEFFIKDGFIYMGKDPVTMEVVKTVGNFITGMYREGW